MENGWRKLEEGFISAVICEGSGLLRERNGS